MGKSEALPTLVGKAKELGAPDRTNVGMLSAYAMNGGDIEYLSISLQRSVEPFSMQIFRAEASGEVGAAC